MSINDVDRVSRVNHCDLLGLMVIVLFFHVTVKVPDRDKCALSVGLEFDSVLISVFELVITIEVESLQVLLMSDVVLCVC